MSLGAVKYDRVVSSDDDSSVAKLSRWIKPGSSVLECGPATGIMTKILRNELSCLLTAIEIDKEAAELAKPYCDKMIIGNLETLNLDEQLENEKFDYVILADVLEHLLDPLATLIKLKQFLTSTGEVLVSIPNISHAVILGELIQGKFDYQNDGLLDNTHLKFFTRKSFKELCKNAKFTIAEWNRTVRVPSATEFAVSFQQLPENVKSLFQSYPDHDTYQFLARLSQSQNTKEAEHNVDNELKINQAFLNFKNPSTYFSANNSFSEENADHKLIQDNGEELNLTFSLPIGTKNIRFDAVDSKESFALISMDVRDLEHNLLWNWNLENDTGENYLCQNISYLRTTKSVLNFPINNDPQIHISLNKPTDSESKFSVVISFNIAKYLTDYVTEITNSIDSKQKMLDEYYLANVSLREDLENKNSILKKYEEEAMYAEQAKNNLNETISILNIKYAAHENLSKTVNILTNDNYALTNRVNHLHEMLNIIWASKSWKITRPVRAVGLLARSARGIIRKSKLILLDKIKKSSHKNYTLFKYLVKNDFLNDEEHFQIWSSHQKEADLNKKFKIKPKISIILPVYKTSLNWLKECIFSVINQSYDNWELCIADDFSNDPGIRSVLSTFAASDSRIKVIYRTENGHIAECSQSALDAASGEFISLLDHDDVLHKDALYWVVDKINELPEIDFIYSNENKLSENGVLGKPAFKPEWSPEYFLSFMYTGHLATYRTALVRKAGGFKKGTEGSQDYDLTLRISQLTNKITHIPKILYHWREHPESIALNLHCKDYAFDAAKQSLLSHVNTISQNPVEIANSLYKGIYKLSSNKEFKSERHSYDSDTPPAKLLKFFKDTAANSSTEYLLFHRSDCVLPENFNDILCAPLNIKDVCSASPVLIHENKVLSCGYGIYNQHLLPILSDSLTQTAGFGARLAAMHNNTVITLDCFMMNHSFFKQILNNVNSASDFANLAIAISNEILKNGKRIVCIPEKVTLPDSKLMVPSTKLSKAYKDYTDPYLPKHIDFTSQDCKYI